jgi:hypothetical protein
MNIQTRFNVGDKVFTLDKETFKMKKFVVGSVSIWADDDTKVTYYPKKDDIASYNERYDEKVCFASENELLGHITTKDTKE